MIPSSARGAGPVRFVGSCEDLAPFVRIRLRPADADEEALAEEAARGRAEACERVSRCLGGFGIEYIVNHMDTATTQLLNVSSDLVDSLDPTAAMDRLLMGMDCEPGHLRLADGSGTDRTPAGEAALRKRVIRESAGGVDVSRIRPVAALAAMQEGVTCIANNVSGRTGGPLLSFCQDLARATGVGPQVNVYISEREAIGFGRHWDDHDVLVVQGMGSKRWRIFEPGELSPLDGWVNKRSFGRETFSVVMEPGAALYIPRGWGHEVRGFDGELSMHYTIGFRQMTPVDILEDAARQAEKRPGSPEGCWTEDLGCLSVDAHWVEHVAGYKRSLIRSEPGTGPFAVERAARDDWGRALFHAPIPGGAVFVDGDGRAEDEIWIAASGVVIGFPRPLGRLLALLLAGRRASVGELAREADLELTSVRQALVALAIHDIVHVLS